LTDIFCHFDVKTVLERFQVAIKRDQSRVDSLPAQKFHPWYDAAMWREWRDGHVVVLSRLISTVRDMQPWLLEALSAMAGSREPEFVRTIILEQFSDVVSGAIDHSDYATADQFFADLIGQVRKRTGAIARGQNPNVSLSRWFPLSDPLAIASDPECMYCAPVSLALLIM
jgi:hypothetical protein